MVRSGGSNWRLRRGVRVAAAFAVCTLGACSRDTHESSSRNANTDQQAAPEQAVAMRLTGPEAFDLIATPHGALLVRSNPSETGSSLTAQPLSVLGREQGQAQQLLRSAGIVFEIAAAIEDPRSEHPGATPAQPNEPTPRQLLVAWIERQPEGFRLRSLEAPLGAWQDGRDAQVAELGAIDFDERQGRGQLAVAHDGTRGRIFSRGKRAPCQEADQSYCIDFAFHDLDGSAVRSRSALTVPEPCNTQAASFAALSERWYYGVCSQPAGVRTSTLFTIQLQPEYARADPLLTGCAPRGLLSTPRGMLFTADCAEGRRGVLLPRADEPLVNVDLQHLRARCKDRALELSSSDWSLVVDAPTSHLQVALPQHLAGPNSRAIWTGQRLLVAEASPAGLGVTNFGCSGSELQHVADD